MYESMKMDHRTHWWHCPYTACGKWSLVSLEREVQDLGDGWWSVTCPACRREDWLTGATDLNRYLPGLASARESH